ncbi:hypothetical protein, partial [Magnetospirillum sp. 64-120]|uniref:hypothetical protein n=2 Tax=Magnetospirillum TaxID=13134 RepID=UPI003458A538
SRAGACPSPACHHRPFRASKPDGTPPITGGNFGLRSDMLNYRPAQVEELKKFANTNFDMTSILETASDLKYGSLLMREIATEVETPSDEFMRMLIGRVYEGKITANVLNKFTPLVQKAIKDTVRELVNQRLTSAMDDSSKSPLPAVRADMSEVDEAVEVAEDDGTSGLEDIVTTQDEIDGYQIVRAIVREVVKVDRIHMRDAKSYCAVLLDDNNRKPICRLHLNRTIRYIGLFDGDKKETRVQIDCLDDIFTYANQLKATAMQYDKSAE